MGIFGNKDEKAASSVKYIMMQGNDFTDISPVSFTDGTCSACNKHANVVSARYMTLMQFVRSGGRGAYHHVKLGTWGSGSVPSPSSHEAGYCERCNKSYHLNCVEVISMGGGTMFRCPGCNSDLAPYPIG